jgi:hypothetical protein
MTVLSGSDHPILLYSNAPNNILYSLHAFNCVLVVRFLQPSLADKSNASSLLDMLPWMNALGGGIERCALLRFGQ